MDEAISCLQSLEGRLEDIESRLSKMEQKQASGADFSAMSEKEKEQARRIEELSARIDRIQNGDLLELAKGLKEIEGKLPKSSVLRALFNPNT